MKKSSLFFFFSFCLLLTACGKPKAGDIDSRVYNLETDFKENYQLWTDMKADGAIQQKEYALDLKKVGNKFKSIGATARGSAVKKLLSEDDQKIYTTYEELGKQIYDVGYALYYGKKEEAKKLYDEIQQKEEQLKE
ncbi:hypothetical protein SAMN02745116_00002 [Pilibacter termitis]|uniref:Lipoprotein n=1 Tax=Pilibacter termitis TaxID=263852 RepID=A0A1T4K098_9ENTE|nr:hypothetical protein [Pilibacter termitis]SJZ35850.1 hypothetical protein SAMN02745116_00002 [Pilibacter termitis]